MKTKLLFLLILISELLHAQTKLDEPYDSVRQIRSGKYWKSYFSSGAVNFFTSQNAFVFNKIVKVNNDTLSTLLQLRQQLSGKQNSLGFTPENTTNKGQANGYASLGSDGKIPTSQLTPIPYGRSYVKQHLSEMLGIDTVSVGDICKLIDSSKVYILRIAPASTYSNWLDISAQVVDPVLSINGKTGYVNLTYQDVGIPTQSNGFLKSNGSFSWTPISINDITNLQSNLDSKESSITTGSNNQVYHGNKSWSSVVLTSDVSGILPVANGGTGQSTALATVANSGSYNDLISKPTFTQSILNNSGTITLLGDQSMPGNNKVYSTSSSGLRGWYSIDHSTISNLDYAHSGHTGFQPTMTAGTDYLIPSVIRQNIHDTASLKESKLGNPAGNGFVLSSTTTGVRSWVPLVSTEPLYITDSSLLKTASRQWNSSPVKNLTSTHIANWNLAYAWGNHAGLYKSISYVPDWSEITNKPSIGVADHSLLINLDYAHSGHTGFQPSLVSGTNIKTINGTSLLGSGNISLTTTESDPIFTASAANSVTLTKISNWDAAYSWGNHAGLYLTPTGNGSSLTGITATQVGLGNVSNNLQKNSNDSTAATGFLPIWKAANLYQTKLTNPIVQADTSSKVTTKTQVRADTATTTHHGSLSTWLRSFILSRISSADTANTNRGGSISKWVWAKLVYIFPANNLTFSTSIDLTNHRSSNYNDYTITGALAVTIAANPVDGSVAGIVMTANGTNTPTFTGMYLTSGAWINTNGTKNLITFWQLGGHTYFSISQPVLQ